MQNTLYRCYYIISTRPRKESSGSCTVISEMYRVTLLHYLNELNLIKMKTETFKEITYCVSTFMLSVHIFTFQYMTLRAHILGNFVLQHNEPTVNISESSQLVCLNSFSCKGRQGAMLRHLQRLKYKMKINKSCTRIFNKALNLNTDNNISIYFN
jgi:hypothetical protein